MDRHMNNHKLIRKFIKVEKRENETVILVCSVQWKSSYEPVLQWTVAKTLETNSLKSEVDRQVNKILKDKRYFCVCSECGECNQVGQTMMLQDKCLCHGCAEKNHRVLF
jgi:formylmethanofuran dehydrogenase subunit E